MVSEQKEHRRVGDVVPSRAELEGTMYHIRDLVGKEFLITGIAEWEGEQGPYLAVSIEVGDRVGFFFSSHQAIYRKLLLCQDQLPLLATVLEKEGKTSGRKYFDIE